MIRADYYKLVRGQIEHVQNMVNQRVIWLVISQSFFYGGYAGVVNAPKEAKNAIFGGQQDVLLWLLPVAAIAACISVYVGLVATLSYLPSLRKKFERFEHDDDTDNDFPPIDATKFVRIMEQISSILLPLVFIAAWVFILVKQGTW